MKSAARTLFHRLLEVPVLLLGWIVLVPLACLVPKYPRLVVVIGREDGQFTDNAKYFCLQAWAAGANSPHKTCFLTRDRAAQAGLDSLRLPVLRYPSVAGVIALLRASVIVVDSAEWILGARFHLAFRAQKVQLWHGVPLKMIELEHFSARLQRMGRLRRMIHRLDAAFRSRYPRYDLVLSTSAYFTALAFARSFHAVHVIEAGYPRNAVLAPGARDRLGDGVWVNADREAVKALQTRRTQGTRLVLYAPTFRTYGANALDRGVLDWGRLDEFAGAQNLHLILKLHPVLSGAGRLPGLRHIEEYSARGDVYPLLPDIDVLITDYSSIYFDFLLLDRPMVFFPYDLEEYQRERGLLFEYRQMTPGAVARTQDELQHEILLALNGPDAFAAERARVRSLAFDQAVPGATDRLDAQLQRMLNGGQVTGHAA